MSFAFVSRFTKKNLIFGIAIFWVGGKNYIVKNENCHDTLIPTMVLRN